MPKVSIIIPVYNTEKYLRKCLDSVCNQTLSDIEIICINDCSTDNSLEILKEYPVKIINLTENKGASFARNMGLKKAQGEYIGFVDSDDFVEVDFYEKLYNRAKATNADSAKGNYRYIKTMDIPVYLNEKIQEDKNNFSFAYCSAIFRKKILDEYDITFPALCDMEDPVFTYKFALQANKVELVDTYINITTREDSQTVSLPNLKRIKDRIEGLKIILNLASSSANISKESYSFIAAFWMWSVFANSIKTQDKDAKKYLIDNIFELYEGIKNKDLFLYELSKNNVFFKNCLLNKNIMQLMEFEKFYQIYTLRNNMKKIKVSVIIPVYNAENYINKCLDSAINQTLKEIEIICINDCSKDNSLDILKKYAAYDDRIKVINNKTNLGESKTRNIGIMSAKGDYIAFLDNDDYVDSDFYQRLYEAAKQENADIAKADVKIYDYTHNKIISGWSDINEKIIENTDKMYFALYWWTAIYKHSLLKENRILLPENMILGGDIVFLNRAVICANKVAIAENTYYHWLRRENSGDSKVLSDAKVSSVLEAYETVLNSLNLMPEENYKEDSYLFVYNMFMSGIFDTIYRNESETNKHNCIKLLFKMYNECKLKDKLSENLLNKYPQIKEFLKNNREKEMLDYVLKYNTEQKLIFSNLRNKIQNGVK